MKYSEDLLDEIKSRNDIVDVVSQYVALKRKGRNYFGLCPFHNEKSPSFSVSPDKQIFHCFGCGEGGNVFHFIMKTENVTFSESVEILANRVGIELPKNFSPYEEKENKLKEEVYKINKEAALFYHQNLYKETSKQAQAYVKKRKLGNNTLKSFLIGYAGNNNELLDYLKEKNFSEETMLASSLIGKSKEGRLYDKFRNRLMFPIQDVRDRVIAFGGRVLDDSKPKYINSPENIVYSKGRNLFGLNVAKRGNHGLLKRILIVEGYMDAISLFQCGITNVVASLGTALTDNQGRLLRRNGEQVILGYDADGAGQTAILRGLDILKSMGIDIRILQISGAKDPDEFVNKYGPEKFIKCMDNAISVVEYKVKNLKANLDLNNTNDKIKFLNEIAKILSDVENTMEREVYIDKISGTYDISKEAIYAEVNKKLYKNSKSIKTLEKTTHNIIYNNQKEEVDEATLKKEKMLIYLLINYTEESAERIINSVDIDNIKDSKDKIIISKIFDKIKNKQNVQSIMDEIEEQEIINYLSGILAYDFEINDFEKALTDIEKTYLREKNITKRNKLLAELENKDITSEQKIKLENELNEVVTVLSRTK